MNVDYKPKTMSNILKFDQCFFMKRGKWKQVGEVKRQIPDALSNDGLLDVTIKNGMRKFEIIRNLKILYDGTILSHPKIDG